MMVTAAATGAGWFLVRLRRFAASRYPIGYRYRRYDGGEGGDR